MNDWIEVIGSVAMAIFAALLMVLWCAATPPQFSAECEQARQELQMAE